MPQEGKSLHDLQSGEKKKEIEFKYKMYQCPSILLNLFPYYLSPPSPSPRLPSTLSLYCPLSLLLSSNIHVANSVARANVHAQGYVQYKVCLDTFWQVSS